LYLFYPAYLALSPKIWDGPANGQKSKRVGIPGGREKGAPPGGEKWEYTPKRAPFGKKKPPGRPFEKPKATNPRF